MESSNIFYLGELNWQQLISCMKKSKYFLHLSFLDHCPNVVVDAKACDCICIVSSSGGTKEICNKKDIVIKDINWDFEPLKLYQPPKLMFDFYKNEFNREDFSIKNICKEYIKTLKETTNE